MIRRNLEEHQPLLSDASTNHRNGRSQDPKAVCFGGNSPSGQPTTRDEGICLKKQLGLMDGVGIIVGVMIGSGIFISPKGVVQYTQSVGMSLVVWAISGLLTLVGAMCYAELGTMIPKSGGDFAYISESFGGLFGFLYLWVALLIIMPTGNTIIALTFAHYILKPVFNHCDEPPDTAVRMVAAIVVCFLTWINCSNVKTAAKIQDIFTVTKVFALTVIIGTGLYYLGTGHTENYKDPFGTTSWSMGTIATSFYQGLFSFSGWNYLNFVVEELKNPYTNLPRAIMISLPTVAAIYFLVNVAYFAVLTPSEIVSSDAVAVTFGNKMLGPMAWIIPVFVACSTFGSLNGGIFSSSRLSYAGAREGHFPDALALINTDTFTPVPSLLFLALVTLVMVGTSNVQVLINYTSFTEGLFIFLSISSLIWMRHKKPNRRRPIRVSIVMPIIFILVSIFLIILPVIERPIELGVAMAIIASGIPVYFLFVVKRSSSEGFANIKKNITIVVQLATNSLPEEPTES